MSALPTGLRPLEAVTNDILNCIHCGFCLPACPTYEVLGDENDSPRGRIYLMRAVAEGRLSVTDPAFARHIDQCLGCRACEPVCPSGVRYGFLLEHAREARAEAGGTVDRLARRALDLLFLSPTRQKVMWGILRLLRATPLPRRLARSGPVGGAAGRLRFSMGMLAATTAQTRPLDHARRQAVWREGGRSMRLRRDRDGAHNYADTVAVLQGCVMSGLFRHVNAATDRVVRAHGAYPDMLPAGYCCGALHAHAGELGRARELARRIIHEFEWTGGLRLITNSAGCGAAMRQYPEWLSDDPAWAERARAVASKARDITEWVAERPHANYAPVPGRVAYDAPCHLLHAQRVADPPLDVLRRIPELEVVPLSRSDRCCGAAGIYSLSQRRLSENLLQRKLIEIQESRANWVATGNPGCMMQIGAGAIVHRIGLRVFHPVELLDRSLVGAVTAD